MSRKDEVTVVFRLDGYQEHTIFVKTQIAGAGAAGFAGNVLIGGVVGMGVDAATGSTLEHVPNPVTAVLTRIAPARPAPRPRTPARPATGAPKTSAPATEAAGG